MINSGIRYLTVFIVALVSLAACGQEAEVQQEERVVAVSGQVLSRSSQQITRTFTGTLIGGEEAVIRAKLSEAVLDVYVDEGDKVSKEQRLLSLDRAGPSSQYQEAESVFRNSEKNFNKMQRLYDEGAISELELDAARTEYEVSQASFSSARQLVDIQTPISGIVVSLPVSKGDLVSVGQVVAVVSQIDSLRASFEARMQDVKQLAVGKSVTIQTKDVPNPIEGIVTKISRLADRETRTFNVEVAFDNSTRLFRPGMFARVQVVVATLDDIVTVPRDAVLRLDGDRVVFVVTGGRSYRRAVIVGAELEGKAVITDGVEPGDTVVVVGQSYLEDSLKVNLTSVE